MTAKKILAAVIFVLAALPAAGQGNHNMTLRLTGSPITSSFVREQIENILENLYGVKPEIRPFPYFSLPPNSEKKIDAAWALPGQSPMTPLHVDILSEQAPPFRDALLLFSDHPEMLQTTGLLFSAGIIFLRPVRLNYYHENGADQPPRAMVIRLDNKNDEPAIVHILEVRAGPVKSGEISTGHRAGVSFLKRHSENLGRIETIPPESYLLVSRQTAGPGELVTGFIEVEELKGHPLQIGVFAEDPSQTPRQYDPLLESQDTHARGAYEMSKISFDVSYTSGEKPRIIPLGDLPLQNLLPGRVLKGAYGTLWEGDLELFNPFPERAAIPLYFQPRGGAASATFVINRVYKEILLARPFENALVSEIFVPPQSKFKVHLVTMPEGGSSYPVYLIVGRSTP